MSTLLLLLAASTPFWLKAATMGLSGYALQSLYKVGQAAVPVLWRMWQGRRGRQIFALEVRLPSGALLCTAVLVACGAAGIAIGLLVMLAPMLGLNPETLRAGFDGRFAVSGMGAVAVVAFLSLLNSALEEFHFRGWLDTELSKRAGTFVGITVSALAFGCMHGFIALGLPGVPPIVVVPMVGGLALVGACWSGLMRRPGGIYAAWLSHGLTDAVLLTWGLWWLGYL